MGTTLVTTTIVTKASTCVNGGIGARGALNNTNGTGAYTEKGCTLEAGAPRAILREAQGMVVGGGGGQRNTSFISYVSQLHAEANSNGFSRKQKRAYQRVMSGANKAGELRFLTLEACATPKRDMRSAFRALIMRCRRRNLISAYFQVPEFTHSGLVHKHLIIRGSYIAQLLLKAWWQELYGASVDIRLVRGKRNAVARYIAKYVSKDMALRWSCSWSWVWRGFCKDWRALKRVAKAWRCDMAWVLAVWRYLVDLGRFDWGVVLRWGAT